MAWELGFLWVLTVALAALWEVMGRGQKLSFISAPLPRIYEQKQNPTELWPREGFKRASHTPQDPWGS